MSKAALKKALVQMDGEELRQLILDLYAARKDMKEYLDFFVEPNIEKLDEKFQTAINKEFDKVKRGGYCKARVTVLKKLLKDYASYQPGFEHVISLHEHLVRVGMIEERLVHFSEAQMRCVASAIKDMLALAEQNFVFDKTITRVLALLSDESCGSRYFRRFLREELDVCLTAMGKGTLH